MKRKSSFSAVIVSMILVCILLVSSLALPAAAANKPSSKDEFKTDYTTKDKKPTYTATLNKNNELLKKLTETKKENKVLKKVKDEGVDWINLTDSTIKCFKNLDSGEADAVDLIDLGVDVVTAIAGIWGFDGLAETIFTMIEEKTTSGNEPLSEIQILGDDLKQEFDVVNDNLYDVKKELAYLSEQVTASAEIILSGTEKQINDLEARQLVREFMKSGDGGFSYYNYSNYLYGTQTIYTKSSEAYYPLLLEALAEEKSNEYIQKYYDRLFDSLYNNIGQFGEYYFDDVAGMNNKSIVMYYYDYLSANPKLIPKGSTAEYEAMMFALDLYTSYAYTYELLEMCYSYQLMHMYTTGTDEYVYNPDEAPVTESIIKADCIKFEQALVKAEEQAAKNIAYIYNMKDSYITADEAGNIYNIGNHGDSFGNIADGQTIYLNVVSDEISKLFMFDTYNFRFNVDQKEYIGADRGVVDSDEIIENIFTATARYGNAELYSIEFTKIDAVNSDYFADPIMEFTGGSGTPEDPYYISNAAQLKLIENDLTANYKLIADITNAVTISPIGTEEDPFEGTFDGNGHTISNLTINSSVFDKENTTLTPATGIFGVNEGTIKDVIFKALSVNSIFDNDGVSPQNDFAYFYIGGIAGINRGVIRNCVISNADSVNSSITVNRRKEMVDDRTVTVYVGGITAENMGTVEYCSVESLAITVDSYLKYNDNEIKNANNVYVGGIAGATYNTIQYCRVSESCTISAYAKSETNTKENEKPHVKVNVGGVLGDAVGKEYISNVYSDCTITKCSADVWNDGEHWGINRFTWDNVSLMQGQYYPVFFPLSDADDIDEYEINFYKNDKYFDKVNELLEKYRQEYNSGQKTYNDIILLAEKELKAELREKQDNAIKEAEKLLGSNIVSDYDNSIFELTKPAKTYVNIELDDNVCDIDGKYLSDYLYKLIDEENEIKNIKFVDNAGNAVDGSIVGHYGFYPYHQSTSATELTVKVFFYVDDTLYTDEITVSVKGKELVDYRIEGFYSLSVTKGTDAASVKEKILLDGFSIVYTYSNGEKENFFIRKVVDENGNVISDNSNTVVISDIDTDAVGKDTIHISHYLPSLGYFVQFEEAIEIYCAHDYAFVETVDANCKFSGYEVWACQNEGCEKTVHKNYFSGDHSFVLEAGWEPTCKDEGYTGKVYCSVCLEVFGKDVGKNEWIQTLPHNYVSESHADYKADAKFPTDSYHYCTVGKHYEAHQYTVEESCDEDGTLIYIYTCSVCNYKDLEADYNIITDAKKEHPKVIITNGYVLEENGELISDQVVVYVQIVNNPGFKGATFGIRYDEGLELISVEEGAIVPKELQIKNPVYNGYNFLWGDSGNLTTDDGYLLKLTFRYTDNAEKKPQNIFVVYGMANGSDGGFVTADGNRYMFATQDGTIRVVSHLPGDVNNDNVVDIMDATYVAWHIVGKTDDEGKPIQVNKKYADVDLDGSVGIEDVLAILQSLSGRYGTSLLSSDYELFFNLGGMECSDMDESVAVQFYDENGNRTSWSENVDFDKYFELMKRLGYTFTGWYTRMDCTCEKECPHLINASMDIAYDANQSKQTLYARWEKNKLVFDMGGVAGSEDVVVKFDSAYHTGANAKVEVEVPEERVKIDCIVVSSYNDKKTPYPGYYIDRIFDGWYLDGKKVTYEELLTLIATPNSLTTELVAKWNYKVELPYKKGEGYEPFTEWSFDEYGFQSVSVFDESFIEALKKSENKLYSISVPIEYTITYHNLQGADNIQNEDTYNIEDVLELQDPNGSPTGYYFGGWYDAEGNRVYTIRDSIGNRDVYAKWFSKVYIITVSGIDVTSNSNTDSWGNPLYKENTPWCTLYYNYGDENHDKGFYKDYSCTPTLKLSATNINEWLNDNFIFGGLYNSPISDNGHSYAKPSDANACVLNSAFELVSDPSLNHNTDSGTLYIRLVPKKYTIKLDANTSSKPVLSLTNSNYTTSVSVYYNEKPSSITTLPQSTYYVPYTYSTSQSGGTSYFSNTGVGTTSYNISGNTTLYCQWEQKYADQIYIASADDFRNKISSNPSGKFLLLQDIDFKNTKYSSAIVSNFSGTLNGNGKSIKNLYIEVPSSSAVNSEKNIGLFGYLSSSANIYSLNFYDCSIYMGTQHGGDAFVNAGILAGSGSGNISNIRSYNCNVTIHRDASRYGGMIGYLSGSGIISNCHAYGIHLYGNGDTGGIVGQLSGTAKNCSIAQSSSRRCSIKHYANTSRRSVGGICGFGSGGSIIECNVFNVDFYLDGDLSLETNMGIIVGNQDGGRIYHVGYLDETHDSNGELVHDAFWGWNDYDYSHHWFKVGWGYAGTISGSVDIE